MQKDEIIIEGFIKTIKESSPNVQGDPVLLNRVFEALEKKKKKRRFLAIFMVLTAVASALGIAILGNYYQNRGIQASQTTVGFKDHNEVDLNATLIAMHKVDVQADVIPAEKTVKPIVKKRKPNLTVSYKFNNHQVDVHQPESEEFVQINVFGSDGSEIDVFKMMEDLKESYRKKEVYVDSVRTLSPTVRRPVIK